MAQIHVLDSETIDKIAAGEVVERPASVVKELVENAMDAGAGAITVEARDGGIEFIRVTDNGDGMDKEQLRTAFLRHATSKIENADDLTRIVSLGFRGEALSSIAAVSKVEVITKTADSLTGSRMALEGAKEVDFSEVGAPGGTTFLVRNLFYNTPVRRKFLKTAATEGGYITDLMEHLALSRPDISFKFVLGSQTRFHTSGNGDLREVIYRIFGREVAAALVPIQWEKDGIRVEGYLGKPVLVRSNRNFEIYFINGRFIRSSVIARAIEEGYKEYLMQHKFPFCVLHIHMDTQRVDVNVHPTKMDVRFTNAMDFGNTLCEAVKDTLKNREMIPEAVLGSEREEQRKVQKEMHLQKEEIPEPFEQKRSGEYKVMEETKYQAQPLKKSDFSRNPVWARVLDTGQEAAPQAPKTVPVVEKMISGEKDTEEDVFFQEAEELLSEEAGVPSPKTGQEDAKQDESEPAETKRGATKSEATKPDEATAVQTTFFEEKMLTMENRAKYQLIGQVFGTYWMLQFEDKLLIIDQHAAHEKVKYERLMKQYREKNVISQRLMPPIIVSLTGQEEMTLQEALDTFRGLGFEIEAFGGSEYALRSVPVDLYGCSEREMFLAVLDELGSTGNRGSFKVVEEKIASMSCKAAVKGNNRLSTAEAQELIDELLTLDNPYNCPHGRPTIITISKPEMEKKFKR